MLWSPSPTLTTHLILVDYAWRDTTSFPMKAYNLRLYQSNVHFTNDDCVLSGIRYCVQHTFRSTYGQDRVFDEHFYVLNSSLVSHVPNSFDLPYNETIVFPLSPSEYQSLVHDVEDFYQQLLQLVHTTIHQAVLMPDLSHLPASILSFATLLGKLFWLKNQDHLRERLWQQLLSYLSCHYYVMVYHQRLTADQLFPLDQHDTLYVPSAAVRDNDTQCNPLGRRRFPTIKSLANSPAVQVPEGLGDNNKISTPSLSFGISSPPLISIMDHLYCPSSIYLFFRAKCVPS